MEKIQETKGGFACYQKLLEKAVWNWHYPGKHVFHNNNKEGGGQLQGMTDG